MCFSKKFIKNVFIIYLVIVLFWLIKYSRPLPITTAGEMLLFVAVLSILSIFYLIFTWLPEVKLKNVTVIKFFTYTSIFFILIIWFFTQIYLSLIGLDKGMLYFSGEPLYDKALNNNNAKLYYSVFYFSGTTFFTLGYGDITPQGYARLASLIEAYIGLFTFAVLIGIMLIYIQKRLIKNAKRFN